MSLPLSAGSAGAHDGINGRGDSHARPDENVAVSPVAGFAPKISQTRPGTGDHEKTKRRKTGKSSSMTMVMRMRPERTERLLRDQHDALGFNVALPHFAKARRADGGRDGVWQGAEGCSEREGRPSFRTAIWKALTKDMIGLLADPEFGDETIASLLLVMAQYKSQAGPDARPVWSGAPQFAEYDISLHPSVVRYGNVELRVVEDYLLDPENLRRALEGVVAKYGDESSMYTNVSRLGKLTHDDTDFNLRRLMTNAGFYISDVAGTAWDTLTDWAQRYIGALSNSRLFWHKTHGFHYLRIQRALHERHGAVPE